MRRLLLLVGVAACRREPAPVVHREPAAALEASASVAMHAPPAPSRCRHAIAPGTDLAHVSDATLRELILGGAPGATQARDCLGATIEYTAPIAARVDRFVDGATHMAVFVSLAEEMGYTSQCPGFAAVVRLGHDEIVAEGVGPEAIDDCSRGWLALDLAPLDGRRALLVPHVSSTGESGDFETDWRVWLPDDRGALEDVGSVPSTRAMGNGSLTSGRWFDALDARLLDAGTFEVEERWELVRETAQGEEHGRKRTILRTYSLAGGKLARSPK